MLRRQRRESDLLKVTPPLRSLTWRYDSGLVVSGVPDAAAALTILTPAQQTSIGLSCGSLVATFNNGLAPGDCAGKTVTAELLSLPQAGAENDEHNPDRVKPRHVLNLGVGSDNLFHTEKRQRFTTSIEIAKEAMRERTPNLSSLAVRHLHAADHRRLGWLAIAKGCALEILGRG